MLVSTMEKGRVLLETVIVRAAESRDIAACLKIDTLLPCTTLASKVSAGEVFVAMAGDDLAGYLRLEYLWSKVPYIGLVFVVPMLRGKGVGRALLGHVCDVLKSAGHRVLLSSSQVNEERPQLWHRKMGFTECGVINGINDGGIGELFFRKDL